MTDPTLPALDGALFAADQVIEPGRPVHLGASRCPTCGRHEFPARESCPVCRSVTSPAALSTDGVVIGVTAVNHPAPGAMIEAPYVVAVGSVPEGVAILGVMLDVELAMVRIGDRVRSVAIRVGDAVGYGWELV